MVSVDHMFFRYQEGQRSVMFVPHNCYGHDNDSYAVDVHIQSYVPFSCRASDMAALLCFCAICTMLVPIMDLGLFLFPPPLTTINSTLLSD